MALFVFCTFWETIMSLRKGACFWERWEDTQYPDKNLIQDEGEKNGKASEP
jgi:hypothetical protein